VLPHTPPLQSGNGGQGSETSISAELFNQNGYGSINKTDDDVDIDDDANDHCGCANLRSLWLGESRPFWLRKFQSIAAGQIENHCGCANLRPLWPRKFKTIVAG
jgi:hypothetical protein